MRGEWFDLPPQKGDFEIPTHIDAAGNPNVTIDENGPRDMEFEWVDLFNRLFRAMRPTKHRTELAKEILNKVESAHETEDRDAEVERFTPPGTSEFSEETPPGERRCRRCGHHYDRSESECPICRSAL